MSYSKPTWQRRRSLGFSEGMVYGLTRKHEKNFRVLDWEKAARIIEERKPHFVQAGLMEDWTETSGAVFVDGERVTEAECVYFCSNWATPILVLDHDEEVECWKKVDEEEFRSFEPTKLWPETQTPRQPGG